MFPFCYNIMAEKNEFVVLHLVHLMSIQIAY